MEPTLFSYIWRYSKRQQLMLLAVTVMSFPILYFTLEIPKLIVNDAIEAVDPTIEAYGFTFEQVEYLGFLCAAFLLFVIMSGVIKMQINTYKGVLAERLLRRFRYQLINRITRFPLPHFRRTSQGELVSIVTSEAEPLGGLMGDAIAQPVFQAGQMLTILLFLFMQNVWFGLAAVALIPLQAYIIPMLQRRINLLNKERVRHVRKLSERIGETVAGVEDLRINNGLPYTMADFTRRLGDLFKIRFEIYQRKFFMKFLNNFINQLTPFFFYAIGGYLVIQGEMTVGALVAALAAYKDLSSPWKELLTYYNQVADMSLRYQTIIEQFAPRGMIDETLFEGRVDDMPHLDGPIKIVNASVSDPNGGSVLSNVNVEIPPGVFVAVKSGNAVERRAFARMLSRGVTPSSGRIEIGERPLQSLHQSVIASRIGVATGAPYLFNTSIADNVKMSLRRPPMVNGGLSDAEREEIEEAISVGNSPDTVSVDWLDPTLIGADDKHDLDALWVSLLKAVGAEDYLFEICLNFRIDAARCSELAEKIVALRPKVAERIKAAKLDKALHRFAPDTFNPGLDLGSNLLYATPIDKLDADALTGNRMYRDTIEDLGIADALLVVGEEVLDNLVSTFGDTGAEHPLFQKLSGFDAELYERLRALHRPAMETNGEERLERTPQEKALLISLPFLVSAEQLGDAFPESLRTTILDTCRIKRQEMRDRARDLFAPLDPETYAPGLSIFENALFAKVSMGAGAKAEKVRKIVKEVLEEAGMKGEIALLIGTVDAGIAGANLPPVAHERIALIRAAIKKPDILILDRALASQTAEERKRTRSELRKILPKTTIIFLEPHFNNPQDYDVFMELKDGMLSRTDGAAGKTVDEILTDAKSKKSDLKKKLAVLEGVSLFEGLETKQLKLLAYASRWVEAKAGEPLFQAGDPTDGAYVLTDGVAEIRWPEELSTPDEVRALTRVEPGRLVGDLSVIRDEARTLDLVAVDDVVALRIGKNELLDIIAHDPAMAMSLLQTVSGYLIEVASKLRDVRERLPSQTV